MFGHGLFMSLMANAQCVWGAQPPNRCKYRTIIARKLENYHVIPSHRNCCQLRIYRPRNILLLTMVSLRNWRKYRRQGRVKIQYATFIRSDNFLCHFDWDSDIHTQSHIEKKNNENLNRNSIDIINPKPLDFSPNMPASCLFVRM